MLNRHFLIGLLTVLSSLSASAYCFKEAASLYSVPEDLIKAIAHVESGNRAELVSKPNLNGTYDIGLMQINTVHLPELQKYGINEQALMDPCINVKVGAWILARSIQVHGSNWRAVGAYNARAKDNEYYRKVYVTKVIGALNAHQPRAPKETPAQQAAHAMVVME